MQRVQRHGHRGGKEPSPTYATWASMKQRCLNPENPSYPRYGGRGIKVCARWLRFANFLADMGEKPPGLTLERIDNDGDYEPGNCQWATYSEQRRNQRPRATPPPVQAITIRLPADLYERLRLAAFERHVSQASIIIRALERELADHDAS